MPRNPQSLSLFNSLQNLNYIPVGVNSSLGQPTEVKTSNGLILKIVQTGGFKRAVASSGEETVPVPFIAENTNQNTVLFNELLSTYFPGQVVTQVLKQDSAQNANRSTPLSENERDVPNDNIPFDQRLVYLIDEKTGNVLYSLSTDVEKELVDGFMVPPKPTDNPKIPRNANSKDVDTSKFTDFYGVPSIMNENSYINLQAAGGKGQNKLLVDRENQPRFYDSRNPQSDTNLGAAKTPTTTNIINWSTLDNNKYKFPYKYQDFVFCKWWQKIPNNYMITLRRYPYPVSDAVTSPAEVRRELKIENLYPISTMITFMGEESDNKISSIVGPIETSLNWKDVVADVWEVSQNTEFPSVNNPAPGLAKVLGFLQSGAIGAKDQRAPLTPIDPYENGPYANKILGPVNVITKTKARDRGLDFKHDITLVFEYSIRSIGGINTKAVGLDILANALLMTSASAPFWGGMNRFAPHVNHGELDPFLGGNAGRNLWIQGNPQGFFDALKTQFTQILGNISDLFNKITSDPIGGLKEIASKGSSEFMKLNTSNARTQITGIHSILTGAPVGEWHVQVGSPFNPLMMIGNLICTGGKIEFNDELGPDDFPTEIKVTVTLEHGMPRDKDAIESMFNYGQGRIYSLPKGYANTFYSSKQSGVDNPTNRKTSDPTGGTEGSGSAVSATEAGRGGQGSRRAIIRGSQANRSQRPSVVGGEVAYSQLYSPVKLAKDALTRSAYVSLYGLGTANPADDPGAKKNSKINPNTSI